MPGQIFDQHIWNDSGMPRFDGVFALDDGLVDLGADR